MNALIAKTLSLWVRPSVLPSSPAALLQSKNSLNQSGQPARILYMLESGSRTDRAALEIVCKQHGLPSPAAGFRFGSVEFAESVDILKKRRRRLFGKTAHGMTTAIGALVQQAGEALESSAADCLIVPVSVYWGQEPNREDSFWKVYFSEHWEIAGRTRKFLITMVHGRHTLLRFSEPVSLREFVNNDTPPAVLERKLLRILRVHFRRRRRATLGPDLSHRRMLLEHVVADPDVRLVVGREAGDDNSRLENLSLKAAQCANEIAANMSYRTVRMMHWILQRLWTRLYQGVELSGLERLDAVVEGREIVYVPCHRSHIDYLLLSYILYINGYSLPHTAAGINLNIPFVGGILRRCGAFFLRRSFAGDKIYAAVFNTYLKELVQRGHALEYFIEGGRSRSGYLLPAKPGMLSMTVQAYLKEPVRPVCFVPVYFGYERLLEGRAFTNELAGGRKRKESLLGLLKAVRTLREDYGRVYVNFGQPLNLNDVLDAKLPDWRQLSDGFAQTSGTDTPALSEQPDYRDFMTCIGREILTNINSAASVTPLSLIAIVMLLAPGKTLVREELEFQAGKLHQLLSYLYPDSLVVLPQATPPEWVEHAFSLKFLQHAKDELGGLIRVTPRQITSLMYFRNNITHLLVLPSLIACALREHKSLNDAALQQLVAVAWPFLRAEFYLPGDDDDSELPLQNCLKAMSAVGLIVPVSNAAESVIWSRPRAGASESVPFIRLGDLLVPAIERYFLSASILSACHEGISQDQFETVFRQAAQRYAATEARDVNTLFSKPYYRMMIETLLESGAVRLQDDRLMATAKMGVLGQEVRKVLPDVARHAIVAATTSLAGSLATG